MAAATTVFQWSSGSNSSLKQGDYGPAVDSLRTLLNQAGLDMSKYNIGEDENKFDYGLEEAVSDFQSLYMGITPTGIVDDATLNALIASANAMSDLIKSEATADTDTDSNDTISLDPHYATFFSEDNTKLGRVNGTNIKIVLGDNTIIKTLHNVYMRSVSTEFDTSGNPISEIFEFIAQDLTESDEPNDYNKY